MIIGLAVLPLVAAVVLALCSRTLARRVAPSLAARALSGAAAAVGVATVGVVGIIGFFAVAEVPKVAAMGHWSARVVARLSGLPPTVCRFALVLAVAGVVAASAHVVRLAAQHRRVARELPRSPAGDVVVVPGAQPAAFAFSGGRHARVIITTALLELLPDPALREAVIEHERSHLRHHHLLLRCVTEVAARLNPLLRPVVAAVNDATERWADEDAARQVGPETVARALLTVALAGSAPLPGVVSSLTGGPVPQRVQCLLEPPPRRRWAVGLLVLLVMTSVAAVGAMTLDVDVAEDILIAASHLGR